LIIVLPLRYGVAPSLLSCPLFNAVLFAKEKACFFEGLSLGMDGAADMQ